MKKYIYILFVLILACDSDSAWDCVQTSGPIIKKEFQIISFKKILVNRDIELIIKEGANYEVIVETGENLMNDISVVVSESTLQLTNHNTCNYVREYGNTKVYVTAPDIDEIRSSTQMNISSDGTLDFQNIVLLSEDFNLPDSFTIGDFYLDINANSLRVVSNNISSFYISGQVENLNVGFFAGAGRFEGKDLLAKNVYVFHRGANDMIVNPIENLTGELRGTGNLIVVNPPDNIDVTQFYTGQLIVN